MKLLSRTTLYLSVSLAVIIGVWAVLLYVSMLDEIYDSIDDGLDNYRLLIIDQARKDPAILSKSEFNESNYAIQPVSNGPAFPPDRYDDTLMYMLNEEDFEPVRILHTRFSINDKHYQLQVINSMVEEDDLIADLLSYLIFLYILIVVAIVMINNVVLRRIWRPFYTILDQLKTFDLTRPVPLKPLPATVKEFTSLNESVEAVLRNNIDRYNSQKQFIENASHELQTPLASSINKVELLLEDETISQSHAAILANLLETLERMARLNKALILISSIENRQYHERSEIEFSEIIEKQLQEFASLLEYQQITVTFNAAQKFTCTMNPDLGMILATNLIRNAIIHNYRNGKIQIEVQADSFSVSNTSENTELDHQRLFQRFYRNRGTSRSLGLGLSIIYGICKLSNLSIRYNYSNHLHKFTVQR